MQQANSYAILEIGNASIRLIVAEVIAGKTNILSAQTTPTEGMKANCIVDPTAVMNNIRKVTRMTEKFLGIQLREVVLVFASVQSSLLPVEVSTDIQSDKREISLDDVRSLFKKASMQVRLQHDDLLNIFPVDFIVDGINGIADPKGLIALSVTMQAIMVTAPKILFYNLINCVEQAGLSIIDVYPSFYADAVEVLDGYELEQGANVVNIGEDVTTISIFADGYPRKTRVIKNGMSKVYEVLSEAYQISEKQARALVEKFGYADSISAQDIVIYHIDGRENSEEAAKSITERELATYIQGAVQDLLSELNEVLDSFQTLGTFTTVFTGGGTRLIGIENVIEREFSGKYRIHQNKVVGTSNMQATALLGVIPLVEQRERLFSRSEKTVKMDVTPVANKVKKPIAQKDDTFWSKVSNYFFD